MIDKARKSKTFGGLSTAQIQVISLVSQGKSVEFACSEIGKNPVTYYRWVKLDKFRSALNEISQEIRDTALLELKNEVKNAVVVLRMLLRSEKCSPFLRRLVANDILNFCMRDRELLQIEERVSKIEKLLENLDNKEV